MQKKIQQIKQVAQKNIKEALTSEALEKARVFYLGRKGELTAVLRQLKDLSEEEKKKIGPLANQVKQELGELIEERKRQLEILVKEEDWIDVTVPGQKQEQGGLNILTQTQRQIEDIFTTLGFEVADGPEMENEWYNFSALNVPADHPARDMQDTFWIKQTIDKKKEQDRLLLRTHTSNTQVRYMQQNQPPFRIIIPGRAFRNEATDATHEHTLYQFEVLVVGEEVSVAHFKSIAQQFFSVFFGKDLEIRLRPSYFPFTEPSFEFDISCTMCGGEGCRGCKNSGWLEVGGAGMVNQKVFEAAGYPKGQYQGFAWGFGIERLAMMKHKIDDIRLFKGGDLRFLKQF
jgi:phenylalanyl-tRNA synthetase alpha chain